MPLRVAMARCIAAVSTSSPLSANPVRSVSHAGPVLADVDEVVEVPRTLGAQGVRDVVTHGVAHGAPAAGFGQGEERTLLGLTAELPTQIQVGERCFRRVLGPTAQVTEFRGGEGVGGDAVDRRGGGGHLLLVSSAGE